MSRLPALAAVVMVLSGLSRPSQGVEARRETPEAVVSLLAARDAVGPRDKTVVLGLRFELKDDWKMYWRSPGEAGYPPRLDWSGSNLAHGATVAWPAPHRFSFSGVETAGYEHEVILPLTVSLPRAGAPLRARLAVDYLICSHICIPRRADLGVDLPAAAQAKPTAAAHLIDRYAARAPGPGRGIALETFTVSGAGEAQRLTVAVAADPPLIRPDLFVEGPLGGGTIGIITDKPEVRIEWGGGRAVLSARTLVPVDPAAPPALTITVADGARGLEILSTPVVEANAGAAESSLLVMLGLALTGGLILNFMPCVLPVLSLKVMRVMGHGGAQTGAIRKSFLASAAGMTCAFALLAASLSALKLAGVAVGWGVQFQQPVFLATLIAVLVLFAANLWGVFDIAPPGLVSHAAAGVRENGLWGDFASGAVATVLATPCSAPFLGTALGFALTRGPLEIGTIFLALGIGMSLPYLLIAAVPGLAARLPRPGPWMPVMKKILSLALLATALWLATVLAAQVSAPGIAALLALLTAMVVTLIFRNRLPAARLAAASLLALAAASPLAAPKVVNEGAPRLAGGVWSVWSPKALAAEIAAGKVVLVDVAADWCVTCKVNKAAVLDVDPVASKLAEEAVAALAADWTAPDEGIASYLAGFGRYGVPFNAVYGPGAPDGLALPELLTADAVLAALKQAKGP